MKISGFAYIRNGLTYGYPFVPSIKSLLPVVDELIVVVGDSTDGSREEIANIQGDKIKIIDTVWDEEPRKSGKIFAQQSNLGLEKINGGWAIHLQADEVLHEHDQDEIINAVKQTDAREDIDGVLFPFLHFWEDYNHIRNTRRTRRYEIRAFRNTGKVRSYKDSQGFIIYSNPAADHKGQKLRVIKTDSAIYHYAFARHSALMTKSLTFSQILA